MQTVKMVESQSALPSNALLLKQFDDYDVRHGALPKFDGSRDLRKISKLGRGCASNVYLVATECRQQLALKCLDRRKIKDQNDFVSHAEDIIREAHTLSNLDHKNIMTIRGVSSRCPSESFVNADDASWERGQDHSYFFLMDVLEETLMDRINRWSKEKSSFRTRKGSPLWKLLGRSKKRKVDRAKMIGRIETVAMGVAEGMKYLHEQNVIMQDLKPVSGFWFGSANQVFCPSYNRSQLAYSQRFQQNIGFDLQTGRVCLFDMGMARHIDELDETEGMEICGTPRYNAPEVFQGTAPSTESDVYSFGCVLYAICSLEAPFQQTRNCKNTKIKEFRQSIVAGERPDLGHIPSHAVRKLISDCWAQDPGARPSFHEIVLNRLPAITSPYCRPLKGVTMDSATTFAESCASSFRSDPGLPTSFARLVTNSHPRLSPGEEILSC